MTNSYIRVVVAATTADGAPGFFASTIYCTRAEYDDGVHYDRAKAKALDEDYEAPMVCFDENDGPAWLFTHFAFSLGFPTHGADE